MENQPTIYKWNKQDQKIISGNRAFYYNEAHRYPYDKKTALKHEYTTFSKLPFPAIDRIIGKEEYIENDLSVPSENPESLNLKDDAKYEFAYDLNYEDLVNFFDKNYRRTDRYFINYNKEFIEWSLCGNDIFIIGLKRNNLLIGVICARNSTITTITSTMNAIETIYLVVHRDYRRKKISKYLIHELYRQARLKEYTIGFHYTNSIIPKPFGECILMIRHINVKKLYEMEFFRLDEKQNINEKIKSNKINVSIETKGFRKMENNDIKQVYDLFCKQDIFSVYPQFTLDEFTIRFTKYPNVIKCYVVEQDGVITDFVSYIVYQYKLLPPYNKLHETLNVGMLYYSYFSENNASTTIIKDVLYECKSQNIDILNMYNTMENSNFTFECNFEITFEKKFLGMCNWLMPNIRTSSIGIALIE